MEHNQIVVTGLGVAANIALGVDELYTNIETQKWELQYTPEKLTQTAEALFSAATCRRMDLFCKYGIVAAKLALDNSGIQANDLDKTRSGAILSTVWGPIVTTHEYFKEVIGKGPAFASPFLFPYTVTNAVTGAVARLLGLAGVSTMLVGCCPINYAFDLIQTGKADLVLAGGVDNATPFIDSNPQGPRELSFEGSCVVVLESAAHAKKRGGKILAEIKSYATGNIQPQNAVDSSLGTFAEPFQKVVGSLLGRSEMDCQRIQGVTSILGNHRPAMDLEQIEKQLLRHLPKAHLIQPFRGLTNLFGAQSPLNLCAAIIALQRAASGGEGKKPCYLSNSYIYGGNFNSLLIAEYDET